MNKGWVAECQDCPTTIGGYGEQVKEHAEFRTDDKAGADSWADLHSAEHLHKVDVTQFERLQLDLIEINPAVMDKLFGNATKKK